MTLFVLRNFDDVQARYFEFLTMGANSCWTGTDYSDQMRGKSDGMENKDAHKTPPLRSVKPNGYRFCNRERLK
jgi:hypothetical protein